MSVEFRLGLPEDAPRTGTLLHHTKTRVNSSIEDPTRGRGSRLEVLAAVLIAIRPLSALAAAIGSGIATLLFISTISFLFTTPGVVAPSSLHVPMLTDIGGFLIKDVALLGAAVWTLGEALFAHASKGARGVGEDG